MTHSAFGDGPADCLDYKVGPEGVKELQQDQEEVKDPPGREGTHDLPTLEQGGVQNPAERGREADGSRKLVGGKQGFENRLRTDFSQAGGLKVDDVKFHTKMLRTFQIKRVISAFRLYFSLEPLI